MLDWNRKGKKKHIWQTDTWPLKETKSDPEHPEENCFELLQTHRKHTKDSSPRIQSREAQDDSVQKNCFDLASKLKWASGEVWTMLSPNPPLSVIDNALHFPKYCLIQSQSKSIFSCCADRKCAFLNIPPFPCLLFPVAVISTHSLTFPYY